MMIGNSMVALGTLLPLGLAAFLCACGDSAATSGTGSGGAGGGTNKPCNEAPFQCKAGQTCWPNMNVTAFQCLNGGPGKRGDACQLVGGQVTCGEGLICIALQDPMKGVCTPYCDPADPNHACPDGEVCSTFSINGGLQLKACNPGGSTSSTSTTSSSTSTSSTSTTTSSSTTSASSTVTSSASTGTGM